MSKLFLYAYKHKNTKYYCSYAVILLLLHTNDTHIMFHTNFKSYTVYTIHTINTYKYIQYTLYIFRVSECVRYSTNARALHINIDLYKFVIEYHLRD